MFLSRLGLLFWRSTKRVCLPASVTNLTPWQCVHSVTVALYLWLTNLDAPPHIRTQNRSLSYEKSDSHHIWESSLPRTLLCQRHEERESGTRGKTWEGPPVPAETLHSPATPATSFTETPTTSRSGAHGSNYTAASHKTVTAQQWFQVKFQPSTQWAI